MSPRVLSQPPPDPSLEWPDIPGYVVEWVEDSECRVAFADEQAERKCRRPGCERSPVMALRRSNGWWLYCDWHTYGRRVEGDKVLSRRRRPAAEVRP